MIDKTRRLANSGILSAQFEIKKIVILCEIQTHNLCCSKGPATLLDWPLSHQCPKKLLQKQCIAPRAIVKSAKKEANRLFQSFWPFYGIFISTDATGGPSIARWKRSVDRWWTVAGPLMGLFCITDGHWFSLLRTPKFRYRRYWMNARVKLNSDSSATE